jgi:hypothetical protein
MEAVKLQHLNGIEILVGTLFIIEMKIIMSLLNEL